MRWWMKLKCCLGGGRWGDLIPRLVCFMNGSGTPGTVWWDDSAGGKGSPWFCCCFSCCQEVLLAGRLFRLLKPVCSFGVWIFLFSGLVRCRLLLSRLCSCQLWLWQVFTPQAVWVVGCEAGVFFWLRYLGMPWFFAGFGLVFREPGVYLGLMIFGV